MFFQHHFLFQTNTVVMKRLSHFAPKISFSLQPYIRSFIGPNLCFKLKGVLKEFLAMMIFKIDTYHSKLNVYCIHLNNKQKVREETLMYPSLDQSVSKHTSRSGGGEQS